MQYREKKKFVLNLSFTNFFEKSFHFLWDYVLCSGTNLHICV